MNTRADFYLRQVELDPTFFGCKASKNLYVSDRVVFDLVTEKYSDPTEYYGPFLGNLIAHGLEIGAEITEFEGLPGTWGKYILQQLDYNAEKERELMKDRIFSQEDYNFIVASGDRMAKHIIAAHMTFWMTPECNSPDSKPFPGSPDIKILKKLATKRNTPSLEHPTPPLYDAKKFHANWTGKEYGCKFEWPNFHRLCSHYGLDMNDTFSKWYLIDDDIPLGDSYERYHEEPHEAVGWILKLYGKLTEKCIRRGIPVHNFYEGSFERCHRFYGPQRDNGGEDEVYDDSDDDEDVEEDEYAYDGYRLYGNTGSLIREMSEELLKVNTPRILSTAKYSELVTKDDPVSLAILNKHVGYWFGIKRDAGTPILNDGAPDVCALWDLACSDKVKEILRIPHYAASRLGIIAKARAGGCAENPDGFNMFDVAAVFNYAISEEKFYELADKDLYDNTKVDERVLKEIKIVNNICYGNHFTGMVYKDALPKLYTIVKSAACSDNWTHKKLIENSLWQFHQTYRKEIDALGKN